MTREAAIDAVTNAGQLMKTTICVVHESVARDEWDTPETQFRYGLPSAFGQLFDWQYTTLIGKVKPDRTFVERVSEPRRRKSRWEDD